MADEVALPEVSPAALAHIEMPPALVEMVQEDPELLTKLARGQLAVVQHRMLQKLLASDASIAQYVAVHERLAKAARIESNQPVQSSGGGGGQQITINIIRAPGKDMVTIEGEAKTIPDVDT